MLTENSQVHQTSDDLVSIVVGHQNFSRSRASPEAQFTMERLKND